MNKSTQELPGIRKFFYGLMTAILLIAVPLPVFAMEDGAYIVSRSTSYTNPLTGNTVDGGTNIALGDSMAASIIENQVLVEQTQGKTYVTIGIGLMSNISNVRIQTMGGDGAFRDVGIAHTGSHQLSGDTCNHYRFEMNSTNDYISPVIYVEPMGRDVQFFVKLNMDSVQPGTGVFKSEMIPVVEQQAEASENEADNPAESIETASLQTENTEAYTEQDSEKSDNNTTSSQESKKEPKKTEAVKRETKVQSKGTETLEKEKEEPEDEAQESSEELQSKELEIEPEESTEETRSGRGYAIAGISAVVFMGVGTGAVMIYKRRQNKS